MTDSPDSSTSALSWLDAALHVLESADSRLSPTEIRQRIEDQGLRPITGKTPDATIGASLYTEANHERARVRVAGKGRFERTDEPLQTGPAPPGTGDRMPAATAAEEQGMTFLDAAERVLTSFADRRPMHYEAITGKAIEVGWLRSEGLTPAATMNSQLVTDIRRRKERGESPRFTKRGPGTFGLAVWESAGLLGAIEQHRRDLRKQLLEQVRELTAEQFEELAGSLLASMGVEQTEVTAFSGDGGVDVRGELVVADVIRRPVAVQVKHWKTANVRAPAVRELRGSLGPHEIGIIITSRGFSEGAIQEAQRTDVTPIALMGADEFIDALIRYGIGVRKQEVELMELEPFDLNDAVDDGEGDSLV